MTDRLTPSKNSANPAHHPPSAHKTVVLVGGGHTHVQVLRAFASHPPPGVHVILIAKELQAPYSGMLPGLISGHYTFEDCHIDLARLAKFASARLIHGEADGIDRTAKTISINGAAPVAYDIASLDVGITPDLSGIDGAAQHAIAVKPISTLWPKWQAALEDLRSAKTPQNITIIGGGAAGFELSLAIERKLATRDPERRTEQLGHRITLVAGQELLPTHPHRARQIARQELSRRTINLIEGTRARRVAPGTVTLDTGTAIATDTCLITTGAAAPAWLAQTDLPTTPDGYVAVRPTLQIKGDDHVFAVGDCATVTAHPREKSGVFAVRQGPPLTQNIRRMLDGAKPIAFTPQKYFLTLLSLSDGRAIAAKGRFAVAGRWAWLWKDHIDRKFMRRYNDLPDEAESSGSSAA